MTREMQFQAQSSAKTVFIRLLLPLGIASLFYAMRPFIVQPWCASVPTPCSPESVNQFDRIVFQFASVPADYWSNILQNAVGAFLFLVPFLAAIINWSSVWKALKESLTFVQIMLWNIAVMEVVRDLVQRPRPLVYHSPLEDGLNLNQYTSFYSGHTSFVALASVSLVVYANYKAPFRPWIGKFTLFLGVSAIVAIGWLRVAGGRHFPTDVIGGALFGAGVALVYLKNIQTSRD